MRCRRTACLLLLLLPPQVHFINAQGVAEAGIDHGGLMKELLEATLAAGCQPDYGLFAASEGSNLMYPNPAAEAIPQGLALLEFLGGCLRAGSFVFAALCVQPLVRLLQLQATTCRCSSNECI